jgi:hypothetical protein
MANAASGHFDEDTFIADQRHFQLFDLQRLASFVQDRGFHTDSF